MSNNIALTALLNDAETLTADATAEPVFGQYDLGTLTRGAASGKLMPAFNKPGPHTPVKNPLFRWDAWARILPKWHQLAAGPLFITGPTGAGKTEVVKQLANMLNYPVYEVNGHSRLEFPELVGHYTLKGAETLWIDGPLTLAMKQGGIFLINEVDLLDPATATGLNTVLDGSPLLIPETGVVVPPHPGFRFVATANTAGQGDESGIYQGTARLNAAFMDRFTVLVADYLPQDVEESIVRNAQPSLPGEIISVICRLSHIVRQLYKGESVDEKFRPSGLSEITTPLSTRAVLRWAFWTAKLSGQAQETNVLEAAMEISFANVTDAAMKTTLKELLQRMI